MDTHESIEEASPLRGFRTESKDGHEYRLGRTPQRKRLHSGVGRSFFLLSFTFATLSSTPESKHVQH